MSIEGSKLAKECLTLILTYMDLNLILQMLYAAERSKIILPFLCYSKAACVACEL
jgi:hypothetical protein